MVPVVNLRTAAWPSGVICLHSDGEARPVAAQRRSQWKRTLHTYAKVDGFWLPKQNRSVATIRLGGQAVLTIDYTTYKIRDPLAADSVDEFPRVRRPSR